jgi:uncharacterized protein involved in outer membrane biogenesis
MSWSRIIGLAAVLLVLIAIASGVAYRSIDWNEALPYLGAVVKETTGRELRIEGDISFRLWPSPVLTVGKASLSNAEWGSRPVMLEARSLDFSMAAWSLLIGEVRLQSIILRDARLFLEESSDGRDNWGFGDTQTTGETDLDAVESITAIHLIDLQVEWQNPAGEYVDITVDEARIVKHITGPGFDLDAQFHEKDMAIDLTASFSTPFYDYLQGEVLRGRVVSRSPGLDSELEGRFGRLPGVDDLDLQVSASGRRWPVLDVFTGLPSGATPPWEVTVRMVRKARKFELHDLDLMVANNEFAGDLFLDTAVSPPRIEGQLRSSSMDLTALEAADKAVQAESKVGTRTGSFLSDNPVPMDWISELNVSIDLHVDKLELMDRRYSDLIGKLEITGGVLRAEPFQATVSGVTVAGNAVINTNTRPPTLSTAVTAQQIDMGEITGYWSQPPFMSARGDVQLVLSGTGESLAAILASSTGHLRIVTGEGTAVVAQAEQATATLVLGTIARTLGKDDIDAVKMNCFATNIVFEEGVGDVQVLVLDTENTTILGSGTIDLTQELWDLKFDPKPHTTTLSAKAVPVMLKGSFSEPEIRVGKGELLRKLSAIVAVVVFPPAAVAALLELGAGDEPCLKDIAANQADDPAMEMTAD